MLFFSVVLILGSCQEYACWTGVCAGNAILEPRGMHVCTAIELGIKSIPGLHSVRVPLFVLVSFARASVLVVG